MILTIFQQEQLNKLIKKYSKDCEWVISDECIQYKNSMYESVLYGLGSGDTTKHLEEGVGCYTELTYYYDKLCKYFINVYRLTNGNISMIVYKNKGQGIQFTSTIETMVFDKTSRVDK